MQKCNLCLERVGRASSLLRGNLPREALKFGTPKS